MTLNFRLTPRYDVQLYETRSDFPEKGDISSIYVTALGDIYLWNDKYIIIGGKYIDNDDKYIDNDDKYEEVNKQINSLYSLYGKKWNSNMDFPNNLITEFKDDLK